MIPGAFHPGGGGCSPYGPIPPLLPGGGGGAPEMIKVLHKLVSEVTELYKKNDTRYESNY
jgi:hypothetical protein